MDENTVDVITVVPTVFTFFLWNGAIFYLFENAWDPENEHVYYRLDSHTDIFSIEWDTGVLKFQQPANFEVSNSFLIDVVAIAGFLETHQTLQVNVVDSIFLQI